MGKKDSLALAYEVAYLRKLLELLELSRDLEKKALL